MALEPINTSTILTTTDPIPTSTIDVPGWLVTETMEISFGDYTGRPDVEHVQLAREMLSYFFEQGWYIVAVISAASAGKWESVSESSASRSTRKSSSGSESTETQGDASSQSTENASSDASNRYSSDYRIQSDGQGGGSGHSSGNLNASSRGSSSANGSSTSSESEVKVQSGSESQNGSESEARSDVSAYWASWQKVRLQRKRVSPRKVLESMVGELVESRNRGEKAVADRYTAVIALYSTMLSRTERELDPLADEVDAFRRMMDGVMDAVKSTLDKVSGDGFGDEVNEAAEYQRAAINKKFDGLIASEKSRLITAGLYNSTIWTTVAAGIERERGVALLAVSDKIIGWRRDMAATAASLSGTLESAARGVWGAVKDGLTTPTTMRNEVLKWMLDFAERHNTERAKVEDIAQIPRVLDGIAGGYMEKE